jgi:uncharacterized integral membrane protein
MNGDSFNLIGHVAILLLAIGFVGFLLMISTGFRKMIKRTKKQIKRSRKKSIS